MVQNLFLSSTNLLLKMIGKEEEKEKANPWINQKAKESQSASIFALAFRQKPQAKTLNPVALTL